MGILFNIFDIDGCIMDSSDFYPNLTDKEQTKAQIEQIVKESNEKGKDIKLYPNFLQYYHSSQAIKNIFLTRRKASHFHHLTLQQLAPVLHQNNIQVIFYPEDYLHTETNYYFYKTQTIMNYLLSFYKILKNPLKVRVFDDHSDYFLDLLYILDINKSSNNFNIKCFLIQSNKDWKEMKHYVHYKKELIIKNTLLDERGF